MSVTTTTSSTVYTGTGTGTSYPVPFVFLDNVHLRVTRTVGTVAQVLVHGTDYTLVGARNPGGGTLTLKAPLAAGAFLRVERVVPLLQSARLRTSGPFSPGALEDALDVTVMGLQQEERERLVLTDRVTTAEAGLTDVGVRVTSLESKVLGGDVSSLVDAMAEANADIAAHESALVSLGGRTDALEDGAEAMEGTVSLLGARVTTLEYAVPTDVEFMQIDSRLDNLEARTSTAEGDLDSHEGVLNTLNNRLTVVEEGGGGGDSGVLAARVTALEGQWVVPPNYTTKLTHEGNVGINTENPMQALDVVGNVKVSGAGNGYIFPDGSKQTTASAGGGGSSQWTTVNTTELYYSAGNVGVGPVDPAVRLDVLEASPTLPVAHFRRGVQEAGNATLPTAFGSPYVRVGGAEYLANALETIGFGYTGAYGTKPPGEFGWRSTVITQSSMGEFVWALRPNTSDVAGTEVMRLPATGNLQLPGRLSLGRALGTDASVNLDVAGTGLLQRLTRTTSSTALTPAYLNVGGAEFLSSGAYMVGYGYIAGPTTHAPVAAGAVTTSPTGYTTAAFVVATRNSTSDSTPTERLRVEPDGTLKLATGSALQFPDGTRRTSAADVKSAQLVTSNTLLGATDDVVLADSTSAAVTVTLPDATTAPTGKVVEVRRVNDTGANAVTLKGASTQQIFTAVGTSANTVTVGAVTTVRVINRGASGWWVF